MTKQDVALELYYDGTWHNVAADDRALAKPNPIKITQGFTDEGAAFRPSRVTAQIDNFDDTYRTSNPLSPLYGKVGLNTPCRVSVGGTVRGVGESTFEPDQTDDFRRYPRRGRAWVDVDAAGLLQRIGQWTEPLQSPFRTFNDSISGITGYWPGEDARGTTVARSAIDGTRNVRMIGQSFGSQNSPPGGGTGIDVKSATSVAGFMFLPGSPNSTAGWEYSIATYLGDMTGVGTGYPVIFLETVNGRTLFFDLTPVPNTGGPTATMLMIDADNNTLINQTYSTGSYVFSGRWILWHVRCTVSAGTVTVGVSWRGVDDTGFIGVSGTFSSSATSDLYAADTTSLPEGSTYGHVIGGPGVLNLDSDDRFDAFLGHAGETAADRFARLCTLKGVPYSVSAGAAASMPMGPQGVDTFPNQLKEIAATDDALIFDLPDNLSLYMLCRADRMNQTPALTLSTLSDTDLASPPKEVINDLNPHNVVTASQRAGGDYTATDSTSAMGTQAPPDGVGEYKQTVDVNVDDEADVLPQVASWWLAKGTVPGSRFPSVTVNLVAAPYLIPAVNAIRPGSVIEILNHREYTIRLYVLGWTETVGTHSRMVTFTCARDDVYKVSELDTGRLQANSTIVFPALDATSTTLTLWTGDQFEQWRTGPSGVHIMLGGEEIILGTIGARSGTNPYTQVVTGCTRAVNGIQKAHAITEFVKVVDPIRLTL